MVNNAGERIPVEYSLQAIHDRGWKVDRVIGCDQGSELYYMVRKIPFLIF